MSSRTITVYLDEFDLKTTKDKAVKARIAHLDKDGELIEELWVDLTREDEA